MIGVTIEGMDNLQKIIRDFPEFGYRRPIIAAMRKAAVPVKAAMIAELPNNLKGLKKAFRVSPGKSKEPSMLIGIFANKATYRNSKGKSWDTYFFALWHNYGTLNMRANRFHNFKRGVRKTKTPGAEGIKAGLFVERGWENSKFKAQYEFEKKMDEEITKFLVKNKY